MTNDLRTSRLARLAVLLVCWLPLAALAQLAVKDPWTRATPGDLKVAGAFMTLTATAATRLLHAESPVAGRVELHETVLLDNVMKMREVRTIDVPAGGSVQLKPGGLHVMLLDVKQPLKAGDVVPVTLHYESGGKPGTVTVSVPVRPLVPAASPHAAPDHGMSHKGDAKAAH